MDRSNIILTGFMGTGKTTLGRLLAKRIGYKFIDTDALIEEQVNQTITTLFQTQGEDVFRKLEAELVENLAQKEELVIATGGGLVLNSKNVEILQKTGQIICLTATLEDIIKRVSKQKNARPLLQEDNPEIKITELLRQRRAVYQQFPQISTSGSSLEILVDEILILADGSRD